MKKRYTIAITVAVTLLVEIVLCRSWIGQEVGLLLVDHNREPWEDYLVLTNDVVLTYGTNMVGTLQAGQRIFRPCRHDVWMTEPNDPRVWKIYVDFGYYNGKGIVADESGSRTDREFRTVIQLDKRRNDDH